MSRAPIEQLRPRLTTFSKPSIETRSASSDWPERIRPLRSDTVTETITGICRPMLRETSRAAISALFRLSVSKTVSARIRSEPPSTSAAICSRQARRRSSNVMFRIAGSSTCGLIEAERFVGPTEPATQIRRPRSADISSATFLATAAAPRLISPT